MNPTIDFMIGSYTHYVLTINGSWFSHFTPPGSPPRFSISDPPDDVLQYIAGMEYDHKILPHSPYNDLSQAVVRAFMELHWFSLMFTVDTEKTTDTKMMFKDGMWLCCNVLDT